MPRHANTAGMIDGDDKHGRTCQQEHDMELNGWRTGVAVLLALPSFAYAALGGTVDSVKQDGVHMKAAVQVAASNPNYTVHALQMPSGTLVREYAGTDGKVFAVAWDGPAMPDLRQVLGDYFDQYSNAAQVNRGGHGHFSLNDSGLIIQSGGRVRDFTGKAYVPKMLPAGVTADEIQ
jgi:Protein of unknown function (DUF2844)